MATAKDLEPAQPKTTIYTGPGHEHVNGLWLALSDYNKPASYICGYCGNQVGSKEGYHLSGEAGQGYTRILICPNCNCPTFFSPSSKQYPGEAYGSPVRGLPDNIAALYNEARYAASVGSYTAVVMICRTLLSHLAVENEAKKGESFKFYVNYLDDNHYIPPKGKKWVSKIRDMGNDAVHEIMIMNKEQAEEILFFTENLLRFNYDLPNR
jgi:hypothetical protein